jgi:hypothetical protein
VPQAPVTQVKVPAPTVTVEKPSEKTKINDNGLSNYLAALLFQLNMEQIELSHFITDMTFDLAYDQAIQNNILEMEEMMSFSDYSSFASKQVSQAIDDWFDGDDDGGISNAEQRTSSKAVVIGQGMPAVKTAAKQLQAEGINAKWYQAWSKNFPTDGRDLTPAELNAALARNQIWIDSKINQGYDIYDIGASSSAKSSPFYELEKSRLNLYSYPTIDISWRWPR